MSPSRSRLPFSIICSVLIICCNLLVFGCNGQAEGATTIAPSRCSADDVDTYLSLGGSDQRSVQSNYCSKEYNDGGCLLDTECNEECFQVKYGYSANCSTCFSAIPACDYMCAMACMEDLSSDACRTCNIYCQEAFSDCSGLSDTEYNNKWITNGGFTYAPKKTSTDQAPTEPVTAAFIDDIEVNSALPVRPVDEEITLRRPGKLNRKFRIYTPSGYDNTEPAKVMFVFHGWSRGSYCKKETFMRDEWLDIADSRNYVLVGVDGLSESGYDAPRSFSFPGSSDGVGVDGTTITGCDNTMKGPDYCYPSCERLGRCNNNRCGWTHCLDDDFEFFLDLLEEVASNHVNVNRRRVFAYGYSMGGMFSWSLGQDPRTASKLAGIGAVMGLPLHDHLMGPATSKALPVIGIYGEKDCSVPPGNGKYLYNEVCDGDGYYYVDAFHQHRVWAESHGCSVGWKHPAQYQYTINGITNNNEIQCSTHCNLSNGVPASVDCRDRKAEHGKEPWHMEAVMMYFDDYYGELDVPKRPSLASSDRLTDRGGEPDTRTNKLGRCVGDCDSDWDCAEGLTCHQRDGFAVVPGCSGIGKEDYDYCIGSYLYSRSSPDDQLTDRGNEPDTTTKKLGKCVGDCDYDQDCAEGLTCYQRDGFSAVPGCSGMGKENYDYCIGNR